MKKLSLIAFSILISLSAFAQYGSYPAPRPTRSSNSNSYPTYTQPSPAYNTSPDVQYNSGYTKQNGTVVDPYYSTKSDNTNVNNFNTQGNTNPYTNQQGTRARDYSPEALNYGQGRTIQQGPRGGQYYINDSGNKVYVPKRTNPY